MKTRIRWIRWSFLLLALAVLAGLALFKLINEQPRLIPAFLVEQVRQPDLLEYPEARRCADCHQEIFEAWKKSRHSLAWVSESYIKNSENRSKEKCLACHVPKEVVPGVKPDPRLQQRDDGIYCVPCHVRNGAMNGPYDLFSPPHPTRKNADYRSSKFCSTCHQKTFKEWSDTGSRQTCQSCHMKRRGGRLTQKFPLNWLHVKREVADHSFPKGDLVTDSLYVQGTFADAAFMVRLVNTTVPHRVPTADNGDPRLFVQVTFMDEKGGELDGDREILSPQQDTALIYQKPVDLQFFPPTQTQSARIVLRYQPAWGKERSDVVSLTVQR